MRRCSMKTLKLPFNLGRLGRLAGLQLCVLMLTLFIAAPGLAVAAELAPAQLFEIHCAGCHAHGGNIVRWGKTLKLRALQRNQVDSVAAIANLITNGKNNMSAFGDRLSAAEIEALAVYVREQAERNWR